MNDGLESWISYLASRYHDNEPISIEFIPLVLSELTQTIKDELDKLRHPKPNNPIKTAKNRRNRKNKAARYKEYKEKAQWWDRGVKQIESLLDKGLPELDMLQTKADKYDELMESKEKPPLKLKVGHSYKTREGYEAIITEFKEFGAPDNNLHKLHGFVKISNLWVPRQWNIKGHRDYYNTSSVDIVGEWEDE